MVFMENLVDLVRFHLFMNVDCFRITNLFNRIQRGNVLLHQSHPMDRIGLSFNLPLVFVYLPNFHFLLLLNVLNLRNLVLGLFDHLLNGSQVFLLLLPLHLPHLLVVEKYFILSKLARRKGLWSCLKKRIRSNWTSLLQLLRFHFFLSRFLCYILSKLTNIKHTIPTQRFLMHHNIFTHNLKISIITIPQVQIASVIPIKKRSIMLLSLIHFGLGKRCEGHTHGYSL